MITFTIKISKKTGMIKQKVILEREGSFTKNFMSQNISCNDKLYLPKILLN